MTRVLNRKCGFAPVSEAMTGLAYQSAAGDYDYFENWNTEDYSTFDENPFLLVTQQPLSTFAADVDTASYANIRRFLNRNEMPYTDAVRIEEMVNYFTYDYPEPDEGEPFSVTMELAPTPWNEETNLLLIGLQAAAPIQVETQPANLVFLIDVSGSMDMPDKLDLVKRAYLMLLEQLRPEDRISIVTYASQDAVLLSGATLDDKVEIMTAIENLTAGGSTHGSAGIHRAYELAEEHFIEGGMNRVILATDGDLNVGVTSEGELTKLIEEKRESGVFLSVMGFGTGNLKDDKLEALANNGNGHYAYIDSILEARKVLSEEVGATLFTVAKDVKFQVDFNPAFVKGYRLIGYENRLMEAYEFDDDTKDGGEIGAGHRVTVIYELVSPDSEFPIPSVTSKYQEQAAETEVPQETEAVETAVSEEAEAADPAEVTEATEDVPQTTSESDSSDSAPPDESDDDPEVADDTVVTGIENEMLTVSIRYKEPDADTSVLLTYPLQADGTLQEEASKNHQLASAVAAFGMLLRDSEHKGTASYDMVADMLKKLNSDDAYVLELESLVAKAARLAELE